MSALDQTLVDPNSLSPPRAGGPSLRATQVDAAPPGNANNRSTILPRLADTGDIPQLVTDARDRFETAKVLGRGGAGEVVLARDNDIERPVAVKRLLPELDDPGLIGRFVDEIRVLGALDHPNIVPIHDVGVDPDGRYYYVMKYVEGETLEHIIEKLAAGDREYHARYPFERRVEVFRQVLRAVQYGQCDGGALRRGAGDGLGHRAAPPRRREAPVPGARQRVDAQGAAGRGGTGLAAPPHRRGPAHRDAGVHVPRAGPR
jgi:serine/threonine-protein kinase